MLRDLVPLAGDRRVRQAVDDALDRDTVIQLLQGLVAFRLVTLGVAKVAVPSVLSGALVVSVATGVRLVAWALVGYLGLLVAAYWHEIEDAAKGDS